ncbi:hypothetical protein SLA2020_416380 [Shorea laevis]
MLKSPKKKKRKFRKLFIFSFLSLSSNPQFFGSDSPISDQRIKQPREEEMGGQENVKQLEECSVSNALGTWVFSVAGALLAIPVGIKRKSLAPLVFFGTTGTMLDIIMGISACEREHAERQMKLLEAQNSVADSSTAETD